MLNGYVPDTKANTGSTILSTEKELNTFFFLTEQNEARLTIFLPSPHPDQSLPCPLLSSGVGGIHFIDTDSVYFSKTWQWNPAEYGYFSRQMW